MNMPHVDVGGAFIFGHQNNPLVKPCLQEGLELSTIGLDCALYDEDGSPITEQIDKAGEEMYNSLMELVGKPEEKQPTLSLGEAINRSLLKMFQSEPNSSTSPTLSVEKEHEKQRRVVNWQLAQIVGTYGTELDNLSFQFWDQDVPFVFEG
jgi:hypothetical protein